MAAAEEEQAIRAMFQSWSLSNEELSDDVLQSLSERNFDPQVTYEEDPAWPGAATLTGRREVIDQLLGYREVLGRGTATIEDLKETGPGRWAAAVRIEGESASGAPWDHLWGYTFEMSEGRIKRFRAHFEVDRAFDDPGATEGSEHAA